MLFDLRKSSESRAIQSAEHKKCRDTCWNSKNETEDAKTWKTDKKSGRIHMSVYVPFEKEVIVNTELWIPGGQGNYKVGRPGM